VEELAGIKDEEKPEFLAPEKEEKPSVLGRLSAAKGQEKAAPEQKKANKKKEDMQI